MAVLVVSVKERDLYLKLRNDVKAPFFLAIPLPGCYDKKKMYSKVLADRVRELKETQEGLAAGEMKKAKETAIELAGRGMTVLDIADIVKVSVNLVQEWLSGSRSLAK